jgi:hypothetical protein
LVDTGSQKLVTADMWSCSRVERLNSPSLVGYIGRHRLLVAAAAVAVAAAVVEYESGRHSLPGQSSPGCNVHVVRTLSRHRYCDDDRGIDRLRNVRRVGST